MVSRETGDDLLAFVPKPSTNGHALEPVENHAHLAWLRLGVPVAGGLVVMDRRPELYAPREAWLDANCPPSVDAEYYRMVWAELDAHEIAKAVDSKGGD